MGEKTALDINFSKRFSTNLISNVIYFILNILIGLALTPFFLDTLGVSAYGLIPLATSASSYLTLLLTSLNSSVSRFLTIDLQKGDVDGANITFNSALFGTLGIALILLPISLIFSFYAPTFFNIGNLVELDVILFFALIFISVLIRTWSSTFMVPLFANNRLDLRNGVEISNLLTQVSLIVILFVIFGPSLVLVGIAYVIAAIFSRILAGIYARKVSPYLKIQISKFTWKKFKAMGSIAFWMGINVLGGLLWQQLSLFIVNIIYGDIAGSYYALCIIWGSLIISIAGVVTSIFTPQIYSYYSRNDYGGLLSFTKFSLKITGFSMALPIALIYIFTPELMTLWVGAEYASLWPIIWILLIPVIWQTQTACIAPLNTVCKKVRVPAFVSILAGVLNLALALVFSLYFDMGLIGVAIAYIIPTAILVIIVSPLYNSSIINAPKNSYIVYEIQAIVMMALIVCFGEVLQMFIPTNTFVALILSGIIISIIYLTLLLIVILKKDEKEQIRLCLPKQLTKFIPRWLL